MQHTSVKLETPCEFINITPLNPLISKCQIKVCYVGDEPNRNRSVITKDVAREMANSLPGSPIVGFYNEANGDFEEHNRTIDVSNGKFVIKDTTKPYGFVPTDAKVWFQWYRDDDQVNREYLVTEGLLWTGQYPEAQRIIEHGNNQSMELDDKMINAQWTKDSNGKPNFFIINEAIISKLCILGEDCEPCFEGSNITKIQFSFDDGFKNEMNYMMKQLEDLLNKEGGAQVFTTYSVKVGDSLWSALYSFVQEKGLGKIEAILEDGEQKFAVIKNEETYSKVEFSVAEDGTYSFNDAVIMEDYTPAEEPQFALEEVEAFENEFKCEGGSSSGSSDDDEEKKKKFKKEDKEEQSNNSKSEDDTEDEKSDSSENDSEEKKEESTDEDKDDEEKKKENKYILEEIPEYNELASKYSALESKYNELLTQKNDLESQLQPLVEFKKSAERTQKEDMIKNTFYMLSEEDKKDVLDNIDTYSLDDIEAKLSIICVRNKVSFATLEDDNDANGPTTYNLGGNMYHDESTPPWVTAVLNTAKTLN